MPALNCQTLRGTRTTISVVDLETQIPSARPEKKTLGLPASDVPVKLRRYEASLSSFLSESARSLVADARDFHGVKPLLRE